jgi:hypothetical protein
MPKIKIEDFVSASRRYLQKNLDKVNTVGSQATIRASEAAKLPKDLRDNFARLSPDGNAVNKKKLIDGVISNFKTALKKADSNHDGYLTLTEGKKLPAHVRDNFLNYAKATSDVFSKGPRDTTSKTLVAAHEAAYGQGAIREADAFKKGIAAILVADDGETPRALLREISSGEGETLTEAQLTAKIKKLLKGMELLPVGESSESGGEPDKDWIFAVDINVGSDHGFWVSVSRQSGEAMVNGFN